MNIRKAILAAIFMSSLPGAVAAAGQTESVDLEPFKGELLVSDDFSSQQSLSGWKVENMPGAVVSIKQGELDIYSPKGTTVWLAKELPKNVIVEYDVKSIKDDDPVTRGADANFFIAASEPEHSSVFVNMDKRGGMLRHYGALRMYYVGLGAHKNTKTRMRRYPGDGTKPLLPEHDLTDPKYLNTPNKVMRVQIINDDSGIKVWRDGLSIYDFDDKQALNGGAFGFRTWISHLNIDNFKVYKLKK